MIRELLQTARDSDLHRGDCYVAHVCNYEVGSLEIEPITQVLRDWDYAIEGLDDWDRQCCLNTPWLAVIHEDGVVLAPLDVQELRALAF